MIQNQDESGSFLTFKLQGEEFGAHVSQVVNILEMTKITMVPQAPDYMKGVINLRGMVLPIIDTRVKFNLPEAEYTNNTCIVVMDLKKDEETIHIGAIVDEVISVIEIEASQIQSPPSIGDQYQSDFIYGMAKVDERFIMLLDMHKVMDVSEIERIAGTANSEITV